jgi:hypothetical protein
VTKLYAAAVLAILMGAATVQTQTRGATIESPMPGSTLSGASQTFTWSSGQSGSSRVSQYFLYVGTSAGSNDIYGSPVTGQSVTVGNLPANGSTIYVRIWSLLNGTWQIQDVQYRAAAGTTSSAARARLESPAPGSTLGGATQTFTWSSGQGVSQYFLYVGTSVGNNDIYGNPAAGTSATVGSLPTDGTMVYVRIWSLIDGSWQAEDSQYRAASGSNLSTAPCGDDRDTVIKEYRAYGMTWIPACDDFATSGGTANFRWHELNRSPGSGHPPFGIVRQVLWDGLERTRAEYGFGITVTSGYRCPHGNLLVFGEADSRHQYGLAVDLIPADRPWNYGEWDRLNRAALRAGATWFEEWGTGPLQTQTHVHVDWR